MQSTPHSSSAYQQRGFALVVTVSLMVLLTIIAVGLLTLSSISLRSSSATLDQSRARANARTALMMALGELQKQAGPDTRVTARADVLPEVQDDHPPVLGVWRSWEGDNHEKRGQFEGRPVSPGDYPQAKRSRFLAWLTSGNPTALNNPTTPPDVTPGTGKVTLVGPGSVGRGAGRNIQEIHLPPVLFNQPQTRGALAWWVGGENQKARIQRPQQPEQDSVAGWSEHVKSHTQPDPGVFRMETLLDQPAIADRAVSNKQTDLLQNPPGTLKASEEFFHDLSAVSTGLLTNTATGGWRKDLSLVTENWSRIVSRNQPFFQVEPGRDIGYNIPSTGDYRPDKSIFYPWSAYRGNNHPPIYEHGAVSSWANLQNWATLYKGMTRHQANTNLPHFSVTIGAASPQERFNFLHRVRILPVIARVQWVFSYWATTPPQSNPPPPAGHLQPRLLVTPVVTMWNPYNVRITAPRLRFDLMHTLPNAFRFRVGGAQNANWRSLTNSTNYTALENRGSMTFSIDSSTTFQPGETRIFSPRATTPEAPSTNLALNPGLNLRGGFSFPILNDQNQPFVAPPNTRVETEVAFDSTYSDVGALGVGIYLDMHNMDDPGADKRHLVYRMVYDPAVARQVYPSLSGLPAASLSESRTIPRLFLTTIFGARTASRTHLAAKGLVQTSPLVNYTAMGGKDTVEPTIQFDYPGTAHPVNSPFDYSFAVVAGAGDSLYPGTDSQNRGFIITGFNSADGLSRCVLVELPTKPIQSLAELQNWDLRYENPIPPYAFNLIGNSDATPLIPSDSVFNPRNSAEGREDLQHDDSYCANHLLFDDWFVSSIAPKTTQLGRPSGSETLRKTFEDFVSGTSPLPNRAYRPIAEDLATAQSGSGAGNLFTRHVNPTDSWRRIASRIEVDGMFNVNSTSVTAWRALLGHARRQKTPHLNAAGSAILSGEQDFAFSRFSIAGDTDSTSRGSAGQFSSCSQFAGYRLLDDPTLDRFAEEIVRQVRRRGPFLSLAEFVNRQLTSGNAVDLALAGTIQAALNALAQGGSNNPFQVVQSGSKPSSGDPPGAGASGYSFKEAAVGFNAYGLAGWTRQADVLRPLAPILSARDDTFVIRAYGDARDATGTTITARAVCEAVVRRTRNYVDPTADAADITALPRSAANRTFGRRFEIVSFRWLASTEI